MKQRNSSKTTAFVLAVILFIIGVLLIIYLPRSESSDPETPIVEYPEKETSPKVYSTFPLFHGYKEYSFVEKLVSIAESQLGECEGKKGYTKYGEFFGHPYEAWCTEYVIWCVSQAEKETGLNYLKLYYPKTDYSGGCVDFYSKKGWFFKRGSIVPRRGDIIVFDYDFDGVTDHTGLVTGVEYDESEDKLYILTIEGNIPEDEPGGIVRERRLPADWEKIYGYGTFLISE